MKKTSTQLNKISLRCISSTYPVLLSSCNSEDIDNFTYHGGFCIYLSSSRIPSVLKLVFKTSFSIPLKLIFYYVTLWNLDFFCLACTPFCLHLKLNTMQVLALDYLIAVYPMLLVFLTYIAVTLHDRCPLIVTLWRPIQRVLICIRKEWNIRGSLVQAFATFLVLSYVKILNVSFELLNSLLQHSISGGLINQCYFFSAGTTEYFRTKHLPYRNLALMMTFMFNILPVLLLVLSPYNTSRKYFFNKHSHGLFNFHGCFSWLLCQSAKRLSLLCFNLFHFSIPSNFICFFCRYILCISFHEPSIFWPSA